MFLSLLKSAFRNLNRFKLFSIINVLGLAFGLAISFVILLYVWHEMSADKFHSNYKNIYQLTYKTSPSVQYPTGTVVRESIPEIEEATLACGSFSNLYNSQNEQICKIKYDLVHNNFFDIFTFPLKYGNPETALSDPNSIIITESIANKLFGNENPIGRVLEKGGRYDKEKEQVIVSGVVKDFPTNSSFNSDALMSIANASKVHGRNIESKWNNKSFQLFLLARENGNTEVVSQKINAAIKSAMIDSDPEFANDVDFSKYEVKMTPMADFYFLQEDFRLKHGDKKLVLIYSFIALLILLIAIINYVNLSTSIASQRAKEIGLRKLIGADKKSLLLQIFFETCLITITAFVFALILIELFSPLVMLILPNDVNLPGIFNPLSILFFFAISLFIAFLSSIYPASFLYRFKPISVIKTNSSLELKGGNSRKALIFFQYTISTILLFCMLLAHKQIKHLQNFEPGFKQDNIIRIIKDAHIAEKQDVFINELRKLPGINNISMASNIPCNIGSSWGGTLDNGQEYSLSKIMVDTNYLDLFELQIVEGIGFKELSRTGLKEMAIVNEAAAKSLNLPDLLEQTINEYPVVGIVRDFNFLSASENIEPLILVYDKGFLPYQRSIIVEYSGDFKVVEQSISEVWSSFTNTPFEYTLVKNEYDKATGPEKKLASVITGFGLISIVLCLLGLFGLVTFMINRRTNEMGIRKTFGASSSEILSLLSGEFLGLILISNLIGLPIAWYLMSLWLNNFANRTMANWWVFLITAVVLLTLSLIIIVIRSKQAARINPVEALKYE